MGRHALGPRPQEAVLRPRARARCRRTRASSRPRIRGGARPRSTSRTSPSSDPSRWRTPRSGCWERTSPDDRRLRPAPGPGRQAARARQRPRGPRRQEGAPGTHPELVRERRTRRRIPREPTREDGRGRAGGARRAAGQAGRADRRAPGHPPAAAHPPRPGAEALRCPHGHPDRAAAGPTGDPVRRAAPEGPCVPRRHPRGRARPRPDPGRACRGTRVLEGGGRPGVAAAPGPDEPQQGGLGRPCDPWRSPADEPTRRGAADAAGGHPAVAMALPRHRRRYDGRGPGRQADPHPGPARDAQVRRRRSRRPCRMAGGLRRRRRRSAWPRP